MTLKNIVLCASALAFGLCGCDNGSAPATNGGLATGPRSLDGAFLTVGYNEAACDKLASAVLGEKKDGLFDEAMEAAPADAKDFLEKSGLKDAKPAWASFSFISPKFREDGELNVEDMPLFAALAFDHDFDKIVSSAKECIKEENKNDKFKETTVLGEKAFLGTDDGVAFGCVSLGGKILIIGLTQEALEKGVALYRDGKGGKAFPVDGDTMLKVAVSAIGENIVKKMPASIVEDFNSEELPNGAEILKGLKDAFLTLSATADNSVELTGALETSGGDDAGKLVATANDGLNALKMLMNMAAAQNPDDKPKVDALNSVTVVQDGAKVSVKATLPGAILKDLCKEAME